VNAPSSIPAGHPLEAARLTLTLRSLPEDQVVAGSPATAFTELGSFGGLDVGVWEISPGVARDVEIDELFVVLSGDATVEFVDEGRSIDIGPGSVVRLAAGMSTTWTVRATLRKIYLAPA